MSFEKQIERCYGRIRGITRQYNNIVGHMGAVAANQATPERPGIAVEGFGFFPLPEAADVPHRYESYVDKDGVTRTEPVLDIANPHFLASLQCNEVLLEVLKELETQADMLRVEISCYQAGVDPNAKVNS